VNGGLIVKDAERLLPKIDLNVQRVTGNYRINLSSSFLWRKAVSGEPFKCDDLVGVEAERKNCICLE